MDIDKLLASPIESNSKATTEQEVIHEEKLMNIWENQLYKGGFALNTIYDRNKLTDCYISRNNSYKKINGNKTGENTSIHIKILGRHTNGSFRCHLGTGKQSRPIQTKELSEQMRMMVVFFRVESGKSPWVMADFICFPTWLLHLFQYSNHGTVPGRTDIRFLENASIAKEDHIYRLNHVINSLFRFQLYSINYDQLENAIYLSNYLFNIAGLNPMELPRPHMMMTTTHHDGSYSQQQPSLYSSLIFLLHAPRPTKIKAMCYNCNSKPASRRQLCVACYRYQLKHNTPRPLRLIIANNPTSRPISSPIINNHDHNMKEFYSDLRFSSFSSSSISSISSLSSLSSSSSSSSIYTPILSPSLCSIFTPSANSNSINNNNNNNNNDNNNTHKKHRSQSLQQLGTIKTKVCVNCGVKETHQWYRNLCGHGHWCETCKSYYLRHGKVRPPELFIKAAKRKIDVRSWMDWSSWRSEG